MTDAEREVQIRQEIEEGKWDQTPRLLLRLLDEARAIQAGVFHYGVLAERAAILMLLGDDEFVASIVGQSTTPGLSLIVRGILENVAAEIKRRESPFVCGECGLTSSFHPRGDCCPACGAPVKSALLHR